MLTHIRDRNKGFLCGDPESCCQGLSADATGYKGNAVLKCQVIKR